MKVRRMNLAFDRRPLLAEAALICFAAAAVLTPSDVRSQIGPAPVPPSAEPAARIETPVAPVMPAGDAFAPRATLDDEPRPPLQRTLPPLPAPPPVTAATVKPLQLPAPARVTAIATGPRPTAVVEEGETVRVVAPGDALDGSVVTSIGDAAVVLADGRRLVLAP